MVISAPLLIREAQSFEPIRPVAPVITIFFAISNFMENFDVKLSNILNNNNKKVQITGLEAE